MKHLKRGIILGFLGLLVGLPAWTQQCGWSSDAAVNCFVKDGVSSGLLTIPKGMSLTQYKSYGIAVSKVVQLPSTAIFLLGMAGAASDAIPPTNADGTPNQAAQDAFLNAIILAALRDAIVVLPKETTTAQLQQFARDLTLGMMGNGGVTISPGAFLRLLDSFVVTATSSGNVNWLQVTTNISTLMNGLQVAGLIKLPPSVSVSNIQQFGLDTAMAIEQYKISTNRAHL